MHHVTYIRDPDRTRLIFVLPATLTEAEAKEHAAAIVPNDFRWAAYRTHDGVDLKIPSDNDDYSG